MKQLLRNNKKGLLLGFVFGAIVAPFLATLGLVVPLMELLRPVFVGPMDLIGSLIPNVQIGPDTYYAPWYKWVLTLGFNGICYAIVGAWIQKLRGS